jgi:protein O-mannosyl-transferase
MSKHKRSSDKKSASYRAEKGFFASGAFWPDGALWLSAGIALIVAATFAAYWPCINGAFILDDDKLLTENDIVHNPEGLQRFWFTTESLDYWPVANNVLWLEWRLWGMHQAGYHFTNLFLHAAEALLIWVVLRKLGVSGGFFAALFFALHPVNVETAAWIAQHKDMLAVLFFLLSILWYLKAQNPFTPSPLAPLPSPLFYCLSLAGFVIAMLSKGSVAILPLVLVVLDWWLRGPRAAPGVEMLNNEEEFANQDTIFGRMENDIIQFISRELPRTIPFFLVAAVLVPVNIWFQTHGTDTVVRNVSFVQRLLGAGSVPWFYIYKAFVPLNLDFVYPNWKIDAREFLWWLPLAATLATSLVLWTYRNGWGRPFLFAWGFLCVSLVPVMGLTDVGFMRHSLVADHYQHIALIGSVSLAAAGLELWRARSRGGSRLVVPLIAVAVAGTLALLTWRQSNYYRDPLDLYQYALEKNPDCWMIHNNMGKRLYEEGKSYESNGFADNALRLMNEAISYYKKAIKLNPDFPEAHYNMGLALDETHRAAEAIPEYDIALKLDPGYVHALNNMGNSMIHANRPGDAVAYYERAIKINPNYMPAHNGLGAALLAVGRPSEAIGQFKIVLKWNRDDTDTMVNLMLAYAYMHRSAEALAAAKQALDIARLKRQEKIIRTVNDFLKAHPDGKYP